MSCQCMLNTLPNDNRHVFVGIVVAESALLGGEVEVYGYVHGLILPQTLAHHARLPARHVHTNP